jgi:hypothetical protein
MSILDNFSKIILISEGQIMFYGTTQEALDHFESLGMKCPPHENPADFFIDAITIDARTDRSRRASLRKVRRLSRMWVESEKSKIPMGEVTDSLHLKTKWSVSMLFETGLLLQRDFRVKFRNTKTLVGEIAQTVVITLLLSFVFFQLGDNFGSIQNRVGLLFFIVAFWFFSIVTQLIHSFTGDRDIILRERYSNTYRPLSAFMAKLGFATFSRGSYKILFFDLVLHHRVADGWVSVFLDFLRIHAADGIVCH